MGVVWLGVILKVQCMILLGRIRDKTDQDLERWSTLTVRCTLIRQPEECYYINAATISTDTEKNGRQFHPHLADITLAFADLD